MAAKGPNNQMRARIGVMTLAFVLLGFGLVAVRLLYMQLFHYDFYIQRPCSVNDLHGVGAFLLMCASMEELRRWENG